MPSQLLTRLSLLSLQTYPVWAFSAPAPVGEPGGLAPWRKSGPPAKGRWSRIFYNNICSDSSCMSDAHRPTQYWKRACRKKASTNLPRCSDCMVNLFTSWLPLFTNFTNVLSCAGSITCPIVVCSYFRIRFWFILSYSLNLYNLTEKGPLGCGDDIGELASVSDIDIIVWVTLAQPHSAVCRFF